MRLIDADKLKIDMDCNIDFGGLDNRHMILGQIDNALTVEERKVGKWIEVLGGCKCPFCDMAFSRLKEDCSDNFCPNCGADMKGESNNG